MKFNLSTQQGLQNAIDRLANLIEYGNLLACTDMASLLNSAADIIEGKLKPKTCGTCRFWGFETSTENGSFGRCEKLVGMTRIAKDMPERFETPEEYHQFRRDVDKNCFVRSNENFGCIKHEERK